MQLIEEASAKDRKFDLGLVWRCITGSNLIYHDLGTNVNVKSLKDEVEGPNLICKFI